MEDEILNKKIKYMGIAAATLLTVAPIAAPVFNSATEITAKADTVNDSVKTGTSAAETSKVTDTNTNTNASTDTNDSAKADTNANTDNDNTANVDSSVNTNDSTKTDTNTTAASDKNTTDDKSATSNQTVYKVDSVDYDKGGYNSGSISGSFPAMKDGKEIEITYSVGFNGDSTKDNSGNNREAIMPHFQGYSVNQENMIFGIQRDPNTNEVTGVTLPNGIPVYTKTGSETSTTPESNKIINISSMFPNGEGQEKFSNSTDITSGQKADAQKWESQMKNSFKMTNNMSVIDRPDLQWFYILGSDGWFRLGANNLTPQSDVFDGYSSDEHNKDDFFMYFNDNKDGNNLFFDREHYEVFVTATANDGTVKRNLLLDEINEFLQEKGGKGVTFHFGIHYIDNLEDYRKDTWEQTIERKQVASKDVVVLPPDADSNTNTGSTTNTGSNTNTGSTTNTGSNTNTGASTNTNTNTSTTTDENTNDDKTTPAASYSSVYTPTTGTELYNDNGELITNVSLGKNTAWKVDQKKVVNGVTYLRVATNEWVKVDNGLEIKLVDSVITTNKQAILYNSKGERITNRVLGANTAWRTDRTAQINGQTMYRVATNEWIPASNVQ